jgi:hypothetical protein
MKKILSTLGIIFGVVLILGGIYGFLVATGGITFKGIQPQALTTNPISSLTGYSTNTQSYCVACPVKVLDKAVSRSFAYITTDSVKPVYLFFTEGRMSLNLKATYTTGHTTIPESYTNFQYATGTYDGVATATITDLTKGLKLTATSSPFIIDLSKQINSEVWATSTPEGGVQTIRVQYSQ